MRLQGKAAEEIKRHIGDLEVTRTRYERENRGGGNPAIAGWREIEGKIKDAYRALVRAEISELRYSQVGPIDTVPEMKEYIKSLSDLKRKYESLKPPYYKNAMGALDKAQKKNYRDLAKMEMSELNERG